VLSARGDPRRPVGVAAAPDGDRVTLAVGGPHSRVCDDSARRLLPTGFAVPARQGRKGRRRTLRHRQPKELSMPIILWLLGVPLTVIVLLMLFHVL
jgi:hypothetical protein